MYKFFIVIIFILNSYQLYANENNLSASIKIINKVSGNNYIYEIRKNKNIQHKIFKITLEDCIINSKKPKEYAAYIKLDDAKKNRLLFKSWILSKNLSISQLSHPIYSIKLVKCNNS